MSVFHFKQFAIDQTGCTMRINTDGVLLGGVASLKKPARIIDIGTGTGVIALMLAQRFPLALVDAVEMDAVAAKKADENFVGSPFAQRILCHAIPLADFTPTTSYDLMVSNPPYFLHSLKNHDARKRMARHTDIAFFDQLLERSARWLTDVGSLQLVLPIPLAEWIVQRATRQYGMVVQWAMDIRSFPAHPPIRRILAMGRGACGGVLPAEGELVIYEREGVYSQTYRKLLKDFFLAF